VCIDKKLLENKEENLKTLLFIPGEITDREHCFDRIEPFFKRFNKPVMVADKPWEGEGVHWPTVIYSRKDQIYKMWYEVVDPNGNKNFHSKKLIDNWIVDNRGFYKCYAYSEDGVNWIKPALNLYRTEQYPDNNIVMEDSGFIGGVATVIEDLNDEPDRIYKMLIYDYACSGVNGARTAVSADGLNWNFIGSFPVLPSQDTPSLWHDRKRNRYVAFLKQRFNNVRARMISYSSDFENWTEPVVSLEPDESDPATMNFYGQNAFEHMGKDFGLLSCYDLSTQTADVEIVYAPQGIDWKRLPTRTRVLKPGDPGSWDSGGIYIGLGEPILKEKDTYWVYYCGTNVRHDGKIMSLDQNEKPNKGGIGVATFTGGRIAGQQFENEGWFGSMPFMCPGGDMYLDLVSKDPVYVEVRNTGYSSIHKGYEKSSCCAVSGDGLKKVTWKEKVDLNQLKGKYISIRIYGKNAILYGAHFLGHEKY
jgi:hypothetical protein